MTINKAQGQSLELGKDLLVNGQNIIKEAKRRAPPSTDESASITPLEDYTDESASNTGTQGEPYSAGTEEPYLINMQEPDLLNMEEPDLYHEDPHFTQPHPARIHPTHAYVPVINAKDYPKLNNITVLIQHESKRFSSMTPGDHSTSIIRPPVEPPVPPDPFTLPLISILNPTEDAPILTGTTAGRTNKTPQSSTKITDFMIHALAHSRILLKSLRTNLGVEGSVGIRHQDSSDRHVAYPSLNQTVAHPSPNHNKQSHSITSRATLSPN
jgi:hypothetical protein